MLTIGHTSRARKGTAQAEIDRLLTMAEPGWEQRMHGGISSGEGVIHAVRDAAYTVKGGQSVMTDSGVPDKRLALIVPEFSVALAVMMRDGNTLSETLRNGWDGGNLEILTRTNPLHASRPHISLSGHITEAELLRRIDDTSVFNGFLNRFLLACVKRSQLLPDDGSLAKTTLERFSRKLRTVLREAGKRYDPITRNAAAKTLWHSVYANLTTDQPGMLGAVTARAEAHVLRLSLIYCVLDQSEHITREHVEAGLAVWRYCEASARYLFGDSVGDPIADRILTVLRSGREMSRTDLSELFGRHVGAARLGKALESLVVAGKITSRQEESGGRPRIVWQAI